MDCEKLKQLKNLLEEVTEIVEDLERDNSEFGNLRDLAESMIEEIEYLADE